MLGGAEHDGDVGAVDVGVEEADGGAHALEGDGEIDSDGGLADAAFAAGDSDEILDAGDGRAVGRAHSGWIDWGGHGSFRRRRAKLGGEVP